MRATRRSLVTLGPLGTVAGLAGLASAQGVGTQGEGGGMASGAVIGVVALVGVILAIVVGSRMLDRRRQRQEEALALQSRLSDALMMDPVLGSLPVGTTVHPGGRGGASVTVEVHGPVPSPDVRTAVLDLVRREVSGRSIDFDVEDHVVVDPMVADRHEVGGLR